MIFFSNLTINFLSAQTQFPKWYLHHHKHTTVVMCGSGDSSQLESLVLQSDSCGRDVLSDWIEDFKFDGLLSNIIMKEKLPKGVIRKHKSKKCIQYNSQTIIYKTLCKKNQTSQRYLGWTQGCSRMVSSAFQFLTLVRCNRLINVLIKFSS